MFLSCSDVIVCTEPGKIKRPVPCKDRGRKASRYHLWFAASSQTQPHGVPTHSCAVTGAPGHAYCVFQTVRIPAPRCIQQPPSLLFTSQELSLQGINRLLFRFFALSRVFYPISEEMSTKSGIFQRKRGCCQHPLGFIDFCGTFQQHPTILPHFPTALRSRGCRR